MVKIVSVLSAEKIFEQRKKPHQSRHGDKDRGRSGREDSDGGHRENSWEALMLKLKDEGLVSEYGDHLSYLAIFEAFDCTRENKNQ